MQTGLTWPPRLSVFVGCYVASPFITGDSHWMWSVCKNIFWHFCMYLAITVCTSIILPPPPKKLHLLIQKIFISCLLEAPNRGWPWAFKRKHDRYSWRGLVSLECLPKMLNSLIDSLIIQNLFRLWCAVLSSHNLAGTKTDTLAEALGSWSLRANGDIEQITPSVKSAIKENHSHHDSNWRLWDSYGMADCFVWVICHSVVNAHDFTLPGDTDAQRGAQSPRPVRGSRGYSSRPREPSAHSLNHARILTKSQGRGETTWREWYFGWDHKSSWNGLGEGIKEAQGVRSSQ